ncbi:protein of unknown function [Arthrobacter sp. yr096]|uniref:ferritin-like domain-containing protein n=1 Tax=Arthrobacter sp. yr096 TaxID=1761750 RepID=UPI0008C530CB|nr:ferritin-like domain-containing protein [Arthrobacter sp. yr096]SEJ24671.1 protein of unknown function [Arthrobacter sp. yr096]
MLVAIVALLVAGTGMVLIPRDSGTPPAPSSSETARMTALEDTLRLGDAAAALMEASAPNAGNESLNDTVTLLTTHARALLDPAGSLSFPPSSSPSDSSRAAFISGLSESGQKRLEDARDADGGIARLLAAVGSAQLLRAEKLAAAWQLPTPHQSPSSDNNIPAATPSAAPCPSVSPTPDPGSATTDAALAAAVRSHQKAVYAYQVALKRLDAAAAAVAAKDLKMHELLLQQAEALTRANCADVPTSEAGYRLPGQFAQDPAGSLGALEASSLPVLGDLVALSTGQSREWAVDGLLAAARRSLAWGSSLPALPGLELDAGNLPSLPTPSDSAASSGR